MTGLPNGYFIRDRVADLQRWRGWSVPAEMQSRARAIAHLCTAARVGTNARVTDQTIQRIHHHLEGFDPKSVDWSEFVSDLSPRLRMSELIKAPQGQEKGVLFIPFEVEWARLMVHANLRELARMYHLVLAPSSSPHNLINYVFPLAYPGVLFSTISNRDDLDILPNICSRFVVLPLYASSWVDPDQFRPRPRRERDIDLVMVANWAKFKRHHALFRALQTMPRHLRVHLIGQPNDGRTDATIRRLAAAYGVDNRFTIQSDATHEEVAAVLCRSRASVILSRREGSCVAVAESLFADTPAALLHRAEVGSVAFINSQTGRLLPGHDLGRELTAFIQEADHYSPRAWAEAHISCWKSGDILNQALARVAENTGESWGQGVKPFARYPFPRVIREADRAELATARREFQAQFGLSIGMADG